LLENKINKKKDILVFVQSNQSDILKRLKKRKNFNQKLLKNLKLFNIQLVIKRKNLILLLKIILQKNQLMMV
jgi:dephospho-CoA kinase